MYGLIIWYLDPIEDEPIKFSGQYETIDDCLKEVVKYEKSYTIVQLSIEDVRWI